MLLGSLVVYRDVKYVHNSKENSKSILNVMVFSLDKALHQHNSKENSKLSLAASLLATYSLRRIIQKKIASQHYHVRLPVDYVYCA